VGIAGGDALRADRMEGGEGVNGGKAPALWKWGLEVSPKRNVGGALDPMKK